MSKDLKQEDLNKSALRIRRIRMCMDLEYSDGETKEVPLEFLADWARGEELQFSQSHDIKQRGDKTFDMGKFELTITKTYPPVELKLAGTLLTPEQFEELKGAGE